MRERTKLTWSVGAAITGIGLITALSTGTMSLSVGALLVMPILAAAGLTIANEALHRVRVSHEAEKQAALESNNRFSRLFHASPVAMCLTRLDDGTIAEINAAYASLFRVNASEIIGATPEAVGLVFERRDELLARIRERGWLQDEELRVETRGGMRYISASSEVVELDSTKYSVGTFVDLTQRRQAELATKEMQQRFAELADNVQEVFWVSNSDGTKIEYVNPAYERVFHRSIANLEQRAHDWVNVVHPDDRARVEALLASHIDTRREHTFRIVLPDNTVKTLRAAYFPIRGADGAVLRFAGITADITANQALEEQVRQAQKLESLGLLAGGVAHDFNNILAVIGSSIGMLGEVVPDDDKDLVQEIEKAVKRGASLTRQLLAFSRKQVIAPVVLDVNQVVEETRKMLRRMVGEDVALSCSLDPELRRVQMDSGALVQVMMNLAVNARDAMPRGGRLTMTTRNVGDEVMLEVADSGCGMPPEVVARIFEPFFTTKGAGKGTGLGLSVVHGIVEQAGGRIEVKSHAGVGTTFSIYLPSTASTCLPDAREREARDGGTEKILLVDDDIFVRASAARALRSKGYTVLEATDGNRALELMDEHGSSIELLVTDVVMPGMDGRQLVDTARARRPSLNVLYTSGYTDDAVLLHGVQHDKVAFLEKPFHAGQLACSVRRTLDADPRRRAA